MIKLNNKGEIKIRFIMIYQTKKICGKDSFQISIFTEAATCPDLYYVSSTDYSAGNTVN